MAKFTKTVTVNCLYCSDEHVVKDGKGAQGKQRYRCRNCAKRFTETGAVNRHRFPPNQIGAAIRMFYSGVSYKQLGENLEEQYDIPEPSKSTVYHWVKEYTPVALKAMKEHKAHTGPEWVVDEMVVKVGGEKYWNWNVMDSKTRFILASNLTKGRTARDARVVLRKARQNAANLPKTIKTDRLKSYIGAIEREFGADVKHVQSEGLRAAINNNLSERLQGTFRSRTKTLRGLEDRKSGQLYLDGWVLNYNQLRDHESIGGRTPAEAAKIERPFNSWEDVVRHAAGQRVTVRKPEKRRGSKRKAAVEVKSSVRPRTVEIPTVKYPVAGLRLPSSSSRPKELVRTTAHHPYLRKPERGKGRRR